jgi:hypothetical protein
MCQDSKNSQSQPRHLPFNARLRPQNVQQLPAQTKMRVVNRTLTAT